MRLEIGEAEAIAAVLRMDVMAFTGQYTRLRDDRRGLSLRDRPDGTCIFLDGDAAASACRIQAAKPLQCRNFPLTWQYRNMAEVCPSASLAVSCPEGTRP